MFKDHNNVDDTRLRINSVVDELGINYEDTNYLTNGFIAELNSEHLKKLKNNKNIAFVEEDQKVQIKFTSRRENVKVSMVEQVVINLQGRGIKESYGMEKYKALRRNFNGKIPTRETGDLQSERENKKVEELQDERNRRVRNLRYESENRKAGDLRYERENSKAEDLQYEKENRHARNFQQDNNNKAARNLQDRNEKLKQGNNGDDGVAKGNKERIVRSSNTTFHLEHQNDAPWGISRISSGTKVNNHHTYRFPKSAGKDVVVYILDTGVEVDHPEIKGRAQHGANFTMSQVDTDENGHGTHCAGVIAGSNVGIAKHAQLVGVKVLDRDGSGMLSSVIMGIDFVIRKHSERIEEENDKKENSIKNGEFVLNANLNDMMNTMDHFLKKLSFDFESKIQKHNEKVNLFPWNKTNVVDAQKQKHNVKTIVNMSVGGLKSKVLDYAIKYATSLNIHFSVAAGNDHKNACDFSPSSSSLVLTAGASTRSDLVAFFSNYGSCVDVYAPGVEIKSSWINHQYRVVSGTSMAAPHVTGAMALYLGEKIYEPEELIEMLKRDSYKVIKEPGKDEKKYLLISTRKLLREIYDKSKEH